MSEVYGPVLALSGGIGGAKLALGLYRLLPARRLTVVANPGDDFEHFGLTVCPDLDTLLYTLADLANPELGWGRRDESWHFMETLEAIGGETWFRLGDRDLALHAERTRRLAAGEELATIAADIAHRLGVAAALVPASESPVRTTVLTADGPLAFQHYFVRDRCEPAVTGFRFEGAEKARPCAAVLDALADPALEAIVVCPSNPFISIDPILAVPGLADAIADAVAPVVAVSPLIGGDAVKGPTAKMMRELGVAVTPAAIASHYADILDGLVIDAADGADAAGVGVRTRVTPTWMRTLDDRVRLATEVIDFARELATRG